MVKVLNSITQEKNILIISFFAGILVSSVFFAAIYFSFNIAIIAAAIVVAAAIFTYLALLVIKKFRAEKNDVSAKTEEQPVVLKDDIDAGYGSGSASESEDEEDMIISAIEQEKTEFQVQEELNTRECKRMEQGSLGGPINGLGDPIISGPSNEIPAKIVIKSLPDHMDLYGNPLPDQVIYTENSHLVFESQKPKQDSYVPMESTPEHLNGFYQVFNIPSTTINGPKSQRKLSLAEELLSKWQEKDNEAYESRTRALLKKAAAKYTLPSFQH